MFKLITIFAVICFAIYAQAAEVNPDLAPRIYAVLNTFRIGGVPFIGNLYNAGDHLTQPRRNWDAQFQSSHGLQQLNDISPLLNDFVMTAPSDGKICLSSGLSPNDYQVGEVVNLHWNQWISYDSTSAPSGIITRDGVWWDVDFAYNDIGKYRSGFIVTKISSNGLCLELDPTNSTGDPLPVWNNLKDPNWGNPPPSSSLVRVSRNRNSSGLTWDLPYKRSVGGRAFDGVNLLYVQTLLKDKGQYPPGCLVMIDIEGYPWISLINTDHWRADARGSLIDLVKWCKSIRPDCRIGYFATGANSNNYEYWACPKLVDNSYVPNSKTNFQQDHNYCKPIIDAADYIMPTYYLPNKELLSLHTVLGRTNYYPAGYVVPPYADVLHAWITNSLLAIKRDFPGKMIVPITCYQVLDNIDALENEYAKVPADSNGLVGFWSQNMVWSNDVLDRIFYPPDVWRQHLEDFSAAGCTEIAIWGEGGWKVGSFGYIPWDDNFPWWRETVQWRNEQIYKIYYGANKDKQNRPADVIPLWNGNHLRHGRRSILTRKGG
jgi:hypothetical protein